MRNIERKTARNGHPEPQATPLGGPERSEWMSASEQLVSGSISKEYHCRKSLLDAERPQHDRLGQTGRSMVEMLGVLAIIGVLSVGGIAAFSAAMDTHHVNEILYDISRRAHECIAQMTLMGKNCDLTSYGNKIDGYNTSLLSFSNNQYFGIKVLDVPEKICRKIQQKSFSLASQILPQNCRLSNEMIFLFDNELKGKTTNMPKTCTPETVTTDCVHQAAGNICDSNGFCACQTNQTLLKTGCCATKNVLNGICCAAGIKTDETTGEQLCCYSGNKCCPAGQIYHSGSCHSCDEESDFADQWDAYFEPKCAMCPNRVVVQTSCPLDCLEEDQVKVGNQCHCPFERPIMLQTGINKGKCFTCAEGGRSRNFNWPLGYDAKDIARYCNYRLSMYFHYADPCEKGTVGLLYQEKYLTADGTLNEVSEDGSCVSCSLLDGSVLNSRARCESCGGTWKSTAPGTKDEWASGVCENREI